MIINQRIPRFSFSTIAVGHSIRDGSREWSDPGGSLAARIFMNAFPARERLRALEGEV